MATYACPICGKDTNRRGKSFQSPEPVVSHINGSHDPDHADVDPEAIRDEIEATKKDPDAGGGSDTSKQTDRDTSEKGKDTSDSVVSEKGATPHHDTRTDDGGQNTRPGSKPSETDTEPVNEGTESDGEEAGEGGALAVLVAVAVVIYLYATDQMGDTQAGEVFDVV